MSPTSRDWKPLEALFVRYRANDAAAAREVFEAIRDALRGYFHVRVSSKPEAEDLIQTALLKIHFARDRYDAKQSLKTWVFTIASRTLIDHWRGRSTEDEIFESAPGNDDMPSAVDVKAADDPSPELKTLLHRDLNRALGFLKPIDRSIVYLFGVEGLSMAEIAQSLSLTEGATKLRAHRAYQELRKKL